jgi:hypothetical protein
MNFVGVDMWLKMHARLIAIIPGLNRSSEACQKKFNLLYKAYKLAKMANDVSGSNRKECKFFKEFDQWWHQTGTMTKHISASANNSASSLENVEEPEKLDLNEKDQSSDITTTSSLKTGKKSFQEQTYGLFTKMVENSTVMAKNFEKTNALLENMSSQMDRLIEKL